MMLRATLLCSLALSTAPAWAQGNVPFDKEHIADKAKLEEALTAMKAAEKFAQAGGKDYGQAIALYEKAYAVNPDNADLNVRLGLCHLNGQQRHLAMPYFQKAVTLDPQVPRAHYLAGMALQLNAKWDEAIWEFEAHKRSSMGLPDENPVYNQAEKHGGMPQWQGVDGQPHFRTGHQPRSAGQQCVQRLRSGGRARWTDHVVHFAAGEQHRWQGEQEHEPVLRGCLHQHAEGRGLERTATAATTREHRNERCLRGHGPRGGPDDHLPRREGDRRPAREQTCGLELGHTGTLRYGHQHEVP
ncbi:MAG: tetratricopeptide repeat protein [Flavobacteriales bacterium]|nr:tetratricopeptide repeat protein [Flavobacteriales bacterium]